MSSFLGLIVLIRTFLSFSLEIEIEGTLPWKRAFTQTGASVIADAAREIGRVAGNLFCCHESENLISVSSGSLWSDLIRFRSSRSLFN